jgi:hypothetical protein
MNTIKTRYDTDAPETKAQAEALLKEYYKAEKAKETGQTLNKLPLRPELLSWRLHEDGIMVVVDGASGRKLELKTREASEAFRYIEEAVNAENAEQAALDAQAEADQARAVADALDARAKEARAAAKEKAQAKPKTAPKRYEINMEDGVDEEEGSAAGKALRARQKKAGS